MCSIKGIACWAVGKGTTRACAVRKGTNHVSVVDTWPATPKRARIAH